MKHNNTGWIITHYYTVQVGQEKEWNTTTQDG
jgi:hypothetical protein